MNALFERLKANYYVIAVADGNHKFMIIGRKTTPLTITAKYSAEAANYQFTAMGQCLYPPQFITGIFNPELLSVSGVLEP
jgi:hypothetical protein